MVDLGVQVCDCGLELGDGGVGGRDGRGLLVFVFELYGFAGEGGGAEVAREELEQHFEVAVGVGRVCEGVGVGFEEEGEREEAVGAVGEEADLREEFLGGFLF